MTDTTAPAGASTQIVEGLTVKLPSGADQPVLTPAEQTYLADRVNKYDQSLALSNVSDLVDLDRVMVYELLIYRWGCWLGNGQDYDGQAIDDRLLHQQHKETCVDLETRALTRRGWRQHANLAVGDEVLTLNTDTGLSEWQPIIAMHRYPRPTEVTVIDGRLHSSATTDAHRWPVRRADQRLPGGRRGIGPLRWKTTTELDQRDRIISAVPHVGYPVAKFSDEFVELVAWWWTEGWTEGRSSKGPWGGHIGQSPSANPHKVNAIRRCLVTEFGPGGPMRKGPGPQPDHNWTETTRWIRGRGRNAGGMVTEFSFSAAVTRALWDVAPAGLVSHEFLLSLTRAQLLLFVEASIDGDGTRQWYRRADGSDVGCRSVTNRKRARVEVFQFACVLAGIATHLFPTRNVDGLFWRVTLLERSLVAPLPGSRNPFPVRRETVPFVWCPETANRTWLAERDGHVYFTGNSTELRQIKKNIGIDRPARERAKGEGSIAHFYGQVLARAKRFGIMRCHQLDRALELTHELKSLVIVHDNATEREQHDLSCTTEDIMQWLREVYMPEFDEIDAYFREHDQSIWVRSM